MDFYQPKSIYNTENDSEVTNAAEKYYTVIGEEDFINDGIPMKSEDGKGVYAKQIQRADGSFKNLVRVTTNAKLYNPLSIYGQESNNNFLDRICRSNLKFKTVNDKTWNWYLKFLATKNLSWLYNAEREAE
jgi:hypothetical protein